MDTKHYGNTINTAIVGDVHAFEYKKLGELTLRNQKTGAEVVYQTYTEE